EPSIKYSGTNAPGVGGGVAIGGPKRTPQPGLMKPNNRKDASASSTRLNPRAMSFANRWDVPAAQATIAPTSGTRIKRLRMYVMFTDPDLRATAGGSSVRTRAR